jgi:hypothetical protein
MPDFEPKNYYGLPAWVCYNGHMTCKLCPKVAPQHRISDASWLWSCDCGQSCDECDKLKAVGKFAEDQRLAREALRKRIEDRMVWECRCGLYVCGACRAGTENDWLRLSITSRAFGSMANVDFCRELTNWYVRFRSLWTFDRIPECTSLTSSYPSLRANQMSICSELTIWFVRVRLLFTYNRSPERTSFPIGIVLESPSNIDFGRI